MKLFIAPDMGDLYKYSCDVLRIFALSFLLAGYNVVVGGYFTAVEKPAEATCISLSRTIVALVLSLAALTALFGGAGIWWSPLMAEGITFILTMLLFIGYRKRTFRK